MRGCVREKMKEATGWDQDEGIFRRMNPRPTAYQSVTLTICFSASLSFSFLLHTHISTLTHSASPPAIQCASDHREVTIWV